MTIWEAAGAAIDAGFADPESLLYFGAGLVRKPLSGIRMVDPAQSFDGAGSTLRQISYEVCQADFEGDPRVGDHFTHRGRRWNVQDVTRRDDIGKWVLVVNIGPLV